MAIEPDIIVTGPEPSEIALVVEAKATSRLIDDAERQLKNYRTMVRSLMGLLRTPEQLRIYSRPVSSVAQLIGTYHADGRSKSEGNCQGQYARAPARHPRLNEAADTEQDRDRD